MAILKTALSDLIIRDGLPLLLFARPVQLGNKDQMFPADFD